MILGNDREKVIENIKKATESGDFHRKVEISDPVLTAEGEKEITDRFLASRNKPGFKFKSLCASTIANVFTKIYNKSTVILGEEKLPDLTNGAVITSNHFGPLENTVIRYLALKHGKKRLNVVSQVTNFAMTGFLGFLMNYGNTIPLSGNVHYMSRGFMDVLSDLKAKKELILIYPEQEMWFNYRPVRPLKKGAYNFAAKLNMPIVSCFVEIIDTDEDDTEEFKKVRYVLHILDTLYPDPNKTVKQNSEELSLKDYELKKSAYERAYGKPLDYKFENRDIAGWKKGL